MNITREQLWDSLVNGTKLLIHNRNVRILSIELEDGSGYNFIVKHNSREEGTKKSFINIRTGRIIRTLRPSQAEPN